ncbi:Zinc finger CCCH domain-containing protein 14 [Aphelenchoides fujianensis]|nr:Zinc finger CCCH domain-containing protein 14 [Aphelenchoides fujianensis]
MSSLSGANSTFTKKLRAAIKAKIEEMGIDADDELPDYVMVLAANKKEKPQMKADLQLFLGKHTSPFVDWLFDAFDRIKAGAGDAAKPADSPPAPKPKEKEPDAKKKERRDERREESSSRKSRDHEREREKERHSKKKEKERVEAPSTADLKRPAASVRCGPLQNAVVSILKTNPPPRKREASPEPAGRSKRRRRIEVDEEAAERRADGRRERRRKLRYEEEETVERERRHTRRRHVDEEEVVVIDERPAGRKKRIWRSESPLRVGESPPRLRVERKKEHSPARSPARSPVRSPARSPARSPIRSPRKEPQKQAKRVPKLYYELEEPEEQPERAEKEVEVEAPPPPERAGSAERPATPPNCTTFIIRVGDREIRRVVPNEPSAEAADEPKRKRRADDPGRTALRLLGRQLQRPPAVKKPEAEAARPPPPVAKRARITMAAAEPKKPPVERPSPPVERAAWNGRITIEEDETSDEDEQQIDRVIAALDREQLSAQLVPTAQLTRPAFFAPAVAQPAAIVSSLQPAAAAFAPAVQFAPVAPPNAHERCRFWPNCERGAACGFAHPTRPCAAFPQCAFGEKCLFVHPLCRFNARCTRPHCPFTHDLKGTVAPLLVAAGLAAPPPAAPTAKAAVPCRFQGKCADPHCEFRHPPACRFGLACRNRGCTFTHRRPDLTKFQWTAGGAAGAE